MACAVSPKPLIPATWSVLEKILDALEEKLGSALSNINVIMPFANQLCRMSEEKELRAALAYLDEAGSVIYPQRSEKLKHLVVTKPKWIFMVFSVVASICFPPPLLCETWDRVQNEGIACWDLIDHRLKEARVKATEYADVLNLLNCFFILCPKPCSFQLSASAVSYESEYFVPCLLEVESDGPFAAQNLPCTSKSMSLIICSCKIEFIPEQLHFRLMTCCIERYPNDPMLTHNHSVYQVDEDVELELIYHSKKYIIVTIDTERPCHEIAPLCTDIRLFITEKLHEVKKPGLPHFQFLMNVQHPGPAIPVDERKLICIKDDTPLRRNIGIRRVKLHDKASLECWFYEQKDDATATISQQTLELKANSRCADKEIVSVARQLSTHWEELVSCLSSSFFSINKIEEIKGENRDKILQARKAIGMWMNQVGEEAKRRLLIETMCDIGYRLQAQDVFSQELVEYVYPSQ